MVGEALIRPSSKSSDSLAIHWVVKEGSIKVIEVVEEDKETDASIGNKLIVKVRCWRLLFDSYRLAGFADHPFLSANRVRCTKVLTNCLVATLRP